ncbi:flowering locus T1 [Tripterygium wilfordii]|uniref:Flowering locus T1 n=1 Tax=Tripterygium wilfordii TaxID=458696 RepID=A0A7J7BWW5_TRIWF|nr:flowering locus T1 [Tripterygium wilfordii]
MPRDRDPLVVGRIVGDVLDPFTRSLSLRVTYNNTREVNNGCELKPSHVSNQPRVDIGGDDLRTFYTLAKRLCATRARDRGWEFIGSFSYCFVNWEGKLFMHPDGARISILETSLSFIILDCRWPLFISTVKGRADPVEEGVKCMPSIGYCQLPCLIIINDDCDN